MQKRNLSWLLFSFKGRLNRLPYWVTQLVFGILIYCFVFLFDEFRHVVVLPFYGIILVFVFFCAFFMISIKRLHDRDKSGHWLWFFLGIPALLDWINLYLAKVSVILTIPFQFVSAVIWIWSIIEFGFLRGTDGPNRYGPDPLERTTSTSSTIEELGPR